MQVVVTRVTIGSRSVDVTTGNVAFAFRLHKTRTLLLYSGSQVRHLYPQFLPSTDAKYQSSETTVKFKSKTTKALFTSVKSTKPNVQRIPRRDPNRNPRMPKKLVVKLASRTPTTRDGEALGRVGCAAQALAFGSPPTAFGLDFDRVLDKTRLRLLRSPPRSRGEAG